MIHIGSSKRVSFTQYDMDISKIYAGQVVAVGILDHESIMYKFSHFLPYYSDNVLLSHANETNRIWHDRFGHLNYRHIQYFSKENMVDVPPSIKFSKGTCKGCIVGKHAKHKHDKGKARRGVQVLELIYPYLIEPIPTPSFGNSRYFLTFIDDFSRYCWVFFLKQKSKVYDIFKDFKAYVENFSGNKINVLRNNNGN